MQNLAPAQPERPEVPQPTESVQDLLLNPTNQQFFEQVSSNIAAPQANDLSQNLRI